MGRFQFKKSLGQNFLRDSNIVRRIVNEAEIDKDTLVIEIGPGQGALTEVFVSKCKYALLYEIDNRLESHLKEMLQDNDNCKIIMNDFMKEDVKREICHYEFDKLYVVANLPYYITTPIVTKLIDEEILPDRIVIMIQKEVADRFTASVDSRDYGSLTVFLNYYYRIKKLFDVSRDCFEPIPNVDSAVICMDLKEDKPFVKDMDLFRKVVRDSFRYKRKTLRNNLIGYDLDKIAKVLLRYGKDLSIRAEKISLEIFVEIANELV